LVVLDVAGHGEDLIDRVPAGAVAGEVDDQVDGAGHGRQDEAVRDVVAGEQGQGGQLRQGLTGRVGVNRGHPREPRASV
jgi:hypothetical protein